MKDCLQNLVGLSHEICECLPTPPEGSSYTTSISGLYLDTLVSECFILNTKKCAESDVWAKMLAALENAAKVVASDITANLANRMGFRQTPFAGLIGEHSYGSSYYVTGDTARIQFATRDIAGGFWRLQKIGLLTDATVDSLVVTVKKDGVSIKTYTFTNIPSYSTKLAGVEPLILPLDGSVYEFSYPTSEDFNPLDNNLTCSCPGKQGTVNAFLSTKISGKANGFMLQIESGCDFTNIVCELLKNNVFTSPVATMLQLQAGIQLIDSIVSAAGSKLNAYTAFGSDALFQRRNEWQVQYNELMPIYFKADLTNIAPTNCFTCGGSVGKRIGVRGLRL